MPNNERPEAGRPNKERWVSVVGWPRYEVSDLGRVRRVVRARGARPGRILLIAPSDLKRGKYPAVNLYNGDGRPRRKPVHVLVLTSFRGPCPHDKEARHLDGHSENPRLSNLRWGTPKENAQDRRRHGTHRFGADTKMSKLNDESVTVIRWMVKNRPRRGLINLLARIHGVAQSAVSVVVSGKTWRHVNV